MITIKSDREINLMREAGRITAYAHQKVAEAIRPGISTLELDKIAEKVIRENGGVPAQKGYPGPDKYTPAFPASICASVNDEVIHGIPSKRVILKEEDLEVE